MSHFYSPWKRQKTCDIGLNLVKSHSVYPENLYHKTKLQVSKEKLTFKTSVKRNTADISIWSSLTGSLWKASSS